MPAVIEVQHLRKSYGDTVAVSDVSFTVERGRDLRHPRPQRRGQDHDRRVHRGPARARTPARSACSGWIPRRDRAELRERLGVQLQDSQLPDRLRVGEALRCTARSTGTRPTGGR